MLKDKRFSIVSRPSEHPCCPFPSILATFPCPPHPLSTAHKWIWELEWEIEACSVGAGGMQWSSGSSPRCYVVVSKLLLLLLCCYSWGGEARPRGPGLGPDLCGFCEAVAVLWVPVCAGCALSSKTAAHYLSVMVRAQGPPWHGEGPLPRRAVPGPLHGARLPATFVSIRQINTPTPSQIEL